jgi:hypothetical protein
MDITKKRLFTICDCQDPEHQFVLTYYEDDEEKEMYMQVHLVNYDNFFRRLWTAVRYLFGYRSRYGEFDEVVLNLDSVRTLVDFLLDFTDRTIIKHNVTKTESNSNTVYVTNGNLS